MDALRALLGGAAPEKESRAAPLSPAALSSEQAAEFGSNEISTQKYSVVTFLGKALMEQFRRVANLYFLVLSIAMMIGTYTQGYWASPVSPWTTFGPLCLVVAISMTKEAFEDYKRFQSDNEINNRRCLVVARDGAEREVLWKDLRVGMVVRVLSKQEVPADLICLTSSELKAVCYVETSNIDGETNLKLKEAMGPSAAAASARARASAAAAASAGGGGSAGGAAASASASAPSSGPAAAPAPWAEVAPLVGALQGEMQYDAPNDRIHSFSGKLRLEGAPNDEGEVGGYFPVGARNMLLRGCMLRNTKWVCGMVVYTGKDTKVMKKGGGARSKLSQLEKTMNGCILVILAVQFVLAWVNVIAYALWQERVVGQLPYITNFLGTSPFKIPEWLGNYVTFTILYNNFVPISLYVTVEIVNVFQSLFVSLDQAMYDPESNTPARARTSNLNTDLGQIEYIFSDKTGTLTRNVMEFKQCSVGGRIFGTFDAPGSLTAKSAAEAEGARRVEVKASSGDDAGATGPLRPATKGSGFVDPELMRLLCRARLPRGFGAEWRATGAPAADPARLAAYADAGAEQLGAFAPAEVVALEAFFTCMAVCHTVVAEEDDAAGAGAAPLFQAESPDEAALALAARDVGFAFLARHSDAIIMQRTNGAAGGAPAELRFALFGTHEFDSTRKRMSVVVQTPDKRFLLMCKGADNVIFDRALREESRGKLEAHLTELATTGLRTLVLAQRELSAAEFADWRAKYLAASVAISDREGKLAAVAEEFETGLSVLGATAIEDRLQDGVPEAIADLRRAGIKTWVLTGDKLETAINIGFSCRLLVPGMEIIRVESEDEAELSAQMLALAARFEGQEPDDRRALVITGPALSHITAISARSAAAARAATAAGGGSGGGGGGSPGAPSAPAGPDLEHALLAVGDSCKSVIACRVSPQQKAAIVLMVRQSRSPFPMTLAIGDGANDVGMIQRAEVGVGISGKEGLQAANAADFSIAQFRFLRNLLLVHGRWDYRRMSKVVLYSFYKNVVITLVIFYFNALTGFSGTSFFESIVYSSYNVELALPIIAVGLFDRDLAAATVLAHPSVYSVGLRGLDINVRQMLKWVLLGIAHSLLTFWIPYGAFSPAEGSWDAPAPPGAGGAGGAGGLGGGLGDGLSVYGMTIFCCLFWAMQLQAAQLTLTWTRHSANVLWVSLALWYAFVALYERWLYGSPELFGALSQSLARGGYFLVLLLTCGAVLLLDLSAELARSQLFPTESDVQRELDHGLGDGRAARWGDEAGGDEAPPPAAPTAKEGGGGAAPAAAAGAKH
jgi:magnesium-transporting ATPase (P-type)